jgi:hypothetical protein
MKSLAVLILMLSGVAQANVETMQGRVYTGYVDSRVSPLGAVVDLDKGVVWYVSGIISVLAPTQLRKDCVYEITYTLNPQNPNAIQLVPPMNIVECGLNFPTDK